MPLYTHGGDYTVELTINVDSQSLARRRAERARNRRRSGLLMSILVVFVLCWLPLNIINIAEDFDYSIHCWRWYNITFLSCHAFAMSSTCYNPLLYWWLNQTFR